MKRILVIEDDPNIREAITEVLAMEGFEAIAAEHGQAGLDCLSSGTPLPDVILLDLLMPIKDGYQFRAEQKMNPRISEIPVIVMTANQMQDAKSLGTAGFLRKPVSIEDLLSAINDAS